MQSRARDIAQGTIPVQGSAIGDVDPEPETPSDIQEQTQVHRHSQQQQHTETDTDTDTQTHTQTQQQTQRKTELPPATLKPKSVVIPVETPEKPKGVIQQSPARERARLLV